MSESVDAGSPEVPGIGSRTAAPKEIRIPL
jgi:hypothetical protein